MNECLECGEAVPEPRTLCWRHDDPEPQQTRKPLSDRHKGVRFQWYVPADVIEWVDKQAAAANQRTSTWLTKHMQEVINAAQDSR